MRRIRKTHPPAIFLKWFEENKDKNCDYISGLSGTPAHKALKRHLTKEQGFLCAYTGRRLEIDSSHVEHLKPRTCCTGNEDVDYRNLVVCFPKNGGDKSAGYGAPVKADWWDEKLFVSPCSDDCEARFEFTWSGKIGCRQANDEPADATIKSIALDHKELTRMRRKAIKGFFFGTGQKPKPLKKEEALKLLDRIDLPDSTGRLLAFCFALKQLLPRYVGGHP